MYQLSWRTLITWRTQLAVSSFLMHLMVASSFYPQVAKLSSELAKVKHAAREAEAALAARDDTIRQCTAEIGRLRAESDPETGGAAALAAQVQKLTSELGRVKHQAREFELQIAARDDTIKQYVADLARLEAESMAEGGPAAAAAANAARLTSELGRVKHQASLRFPRLFVCLFVCCFFTCSGYNDWATAAFAGTPLAVDGRLLCILYQQRSLLGLACSRAGAGRGHASQATAAPNNNLSSLFFYSAF